MPGCSSVHILLGPALGHIAALVAAGCTDRSAETALCRNHCIPVAAVEDLTSRRRLAAEKEVAAGSLPPDSVSHICLPAQVLDSGPAMEGRAVVCCS